MESLEEKSTNEKTSLQRFEKIRTAAELGLGAVPVVGMTAIGLYITACGLLKKEYIATGFGALVTSISAGFFAVYVHSAAKMWRDRYKQHNDKPTDERA